MNKNRPGNKVVGSYVAGAIQCTVGGILALTFGIVLLVNGVTGFLGRVTAVVMLVFLLAGAALLVRGVANCVLASHSRRVQAVMADKSREKLSLIAKMTRQDLSSLVRELRLLSSRGFFPGAYVDLYRRDFVARAGGPLPPFTPGPTVLREVRRKSILPVYAVGAVWVAYATAFPLYKAYHFIIAGAASILLFVLLRRILPEHIAIVEEDRKPEPPPKPETIDTGNTELDEVLTTGMGYMRQLTELNLAITNEHIDGPVQELTHICKQIFEEVRKHPEKIRQIRQFLNYYLPTTIKLLKNYDEFSREKVKGDNIKTAIKKIEDTMQSILTAFQKELDSLYQDRMLDISVDIEVMQNMMEQEGLADGLSGGSRSRK